MAKELDKDIMFRERKRWLFLGLPFTFTVYILKDDMLTVDTGFFKKVENDCYMYKIQDVQHTASLVERMFGLGTITCHTGDTTHPTLKLVHIKNSKQIKNYILEASEAARMRRRTLNTLDIGTGDIDVADIDA
ncbi:MAG: PH domain-containing protein [Lachnospiraceae bacterium]|nr:PH domain-containing protein [Lachnospiraceae bacterium]MBQ7780481.1 PH domain-containing protein [Lachnospiraceae bacterium]